MPWIWCIETLVNQVCGNMYIYNDLCMLDSVWNQVMSCGIPLIVLCHCYSLLLYFHCDLHHWNSLCWSDRVEILYDMACIWILYFPFLCTSLIMPSATFELSKFFFRNITQSHCIKFFLWQNVHTHPYLFDVSTLLLLVSPSTLFVLEWECFWPVKSIISPHIFLYMYLFI